VEEEMTPEERIARLEVEVENVKREITQTFEALKGLEDELKKLQWRIAAFTGGLLVLATIVDKLIK
jgi:phage shock protein A